MKIINKVSVSNCTGTVLFFFKAQDYVYFIILKPTYTGNLTTIAFVNLVEKVINNKKYALVNGTWVIINVTDKKCSVILSVYMVPFSNRLLLISISSIIYL